MLCIYLVGLVRYGTPPSSDRKKQNHWTLTTNDIWVHYFKDAGFFRIYWESVAGMASLLHSAILIC